MSSEIILIGNIAIYVATFVYFYKKNSSRLGLYILLLYTLSSIFAYLFFIQPGFMNTVHGSYMTVMPFVYLYVCLLLMIYPILKNDIGNADICTYQWKYNNLNTFLVVASCIYLFLIYMNFHDAVANMSGDIATNRENVYGETGVNIRTNALATNAIYINLDCLMKAVAYYIIIMTAHLAFFEPLVRKKALFLMGLSFLYCLESGIVLVSRGPILCLLLSMGFIYLVYYNYISRKVKKIVIFTCLSLIPIGIGYSNMISEARFSSDILEFFYYKYLGESMTNFNGLMFDNLKGTTNGQAYFTFFIRPFYYIPYLNGYQKWEFIEKNTGVSGQYFYTVVGGLLFEFGKIFTLIISIWCCWFQNKKYKVQSYGITLPQLFILIFFAKQLIFGVWLFNLQGPEGGYEIVGLFLLCYAFRKNYFTI